MFLKNIFILTICFNLIAMVHGQNNKDIKNITVLDKVKTDFPDEYPEIIKLIKLSVTYREDIAERVVPVSLYSGESLLLMAQIGEVCNFNVDKMRSDFPHICKNSGFIGIIRGTPAYKHDRILLMFRNAHDLIFILGPNGATWNFQIDNDVKTSCHDPSSVCVRYLKTKEIDKDLLVAVYYPRQLSFDSNARKVVSLIDIGLPPSGDDQQEHPTLLAEKTVKLPRGNYPKDDPDFQMEYWPFDQAINHYTGWTR